MVKTEKNEEKIKKPNLIYSQMEFKQICGKSVAVQYRQELNDKISRNLARIFVRFLTNILRNNAKGSARYRTRFLKTLIGDFSKYCASQKSSFTNDAF